MTEDRPSLKISSVSERDIDLLLLEEFMSSSDFCQRFLDTIGIHDRKCRFAAGERSATDETGESDLEIGFDGPDKRRLLFLIENKINAQFQPKQAQRYRERGCNYYRNGKCQEFTTVLFAPAAYFSTERMGFDKRVDYEQAKDWIEGSNLPAGRSLYKAALLSLAIEKSSSRYQATDPQVTKFWREYWGLCMDDAPELGMPEPGPKPAGSTFIYFLDADIPDGLSLVHKLHKGFFDLQFAGRGGDTAKMGIEYGHLLSEGMRIDRAEKSAVIRICVPSMSVARAFAEQKDAAFEAWKEGRRLLQWVQENGARVLS